MANTRSDYATMQRLHMAVDLAPDCCKIDSEFRSFLECLSLSSSIDTRKPYHCKNDRWRVYPLYAIKDTSVATTPQMERELRHIMSSAWEIEGIAAALLHQLQRKRLHPMTPETVAGTPSLSGLTSTLHQYQQADVAWMWNR